jgi:hypothetical protein
MSVPTLVALFAALTQVYVQRATALFVLPYMPIYRLMTEPYAIRCTDMRRNLLRTPLLVVQQILDARKMLRRHHARHNASTMTA